MESTSLTNCMSTDVSEIALALSEFQGSIQQPNLEKEVEVKTKTGYTYKFKYADLSACIKAAAPYLKANGLAVTQIVNAGQLITLLTHKSGQWIQSVVNLPQQSTDYQAFGSALTYLKRYSYCGILGIVADADDDANYAQGNERILKDNPKKPKVNLINDAMADLKNIKNLDDFNAIYEKWYGLAPDICIKGTAFHKELTKIYRSFQQKDIS